jgi:hypothetical protein
MENLFKILPLRTVFPTMAFSILEDKTGKMWFGTGGDVCYYDGKTFTVLRNKDGEAFYNVWGTTEDRKDNIWFGGSIIKDRKGSTLFLEDGPWRYDDSTVTKVSRRVLMR